MNLKTAKPLFISFEGGEGCGKSTQTHLLHDYLNSLGIKVLLTREIGGTREAEKIREVLLHGELLPVSELLLVMAARYEHIKKVILPALKDNIWVICDRFIDSTACYQGQAADIGIEKVYELHALMQPESLLPDLTLFIDVRPDIALARTLARGGNNKFEEKEPEFHQKVYSGFHKLAEKFKHRIIAIDANTLTAEQLHQKIIKFIEEKEILE